jgi:4'-phosphopantetheinyl transferase
MNAAPTVHVLLARPAHLLASLDAADLTRLLGADDLAHAARFRQPRHREQATASRLLQRLALAWAAGEPPLDPAALYFERDPRGRPRVSAPAAAQALQFSVANTEGLVGCAVSRGSVLGLDLEVLGRAVADELLATCCTPRERAALAALPDAARARHFLQLWTLKEACLKARGTGIEVALDALGFVHDAVDGAFAPEPGSGVDPVWQCVPIDAGDGHVGAVCCAAAQAVGVHWVVWRDGRAQLSADEDADS